MSNIRSNGKTCQKVSNLRQDTLCAKNVKSRDVLVIQKCMTGCKLNSNWDKASDAFLKMLSEIVKISNNHVGAPKM